ncbi:NAD(P)-binding protein [Sodiomyces alkalinus F11]|uniref:NAD(P)-binding protein n=1 Tax=Sodiomyces alkalinus (strain CBS 110278 / VKM F-3762 / F11) TaxID=1314773 RepID=A0A3N2PJJ0_SODAK|nr:NAD(P)-binding protein [Sodiomyces alkalinus F11]ROT34679.1 NAD(P)-binding protein [Sodiomyces alkalinus F11]
MGYHDLTETAKLSPPIDTSQPYDITKVVGKTILITGGALGLGAAFARHWAAHGANLVIGDINDTAGEQLVAEFRTRHPDASHHFFHCDVTDWDSQVALFKAAARASPHGGIDVVVANAGVNLPPANYRFENPLADPSDPDAPPRPDTRIIDINVTAAMHTAHLALFWLPRNAPSQLNPAPRDSHSSSHSSSSSVSPSRDRCLLLVGSVAGLSPFVGQVQYTASKHAITGLFRALRGSAWTHGVRTTLLCPYFVSGSNMLPTAIEAAFLAGGAGGASIEDVVDAATRLVADDGIVGRALVVGPRVGDVEEDDGEGANGSKETNRGQETRATTGIWDCYAEDYKDAETFIWRWVRMLNAVEKAKGVVGLVTDLVAILFRTKRSARAWS